MNIYSSRTAQEELNSAFQAARLDHTPYKKAPIAKELFSLNLAGRKGPYRSWAGDADVEAHPDAERRQVVLNVNEGTRAVTRRISAHFTANIPDHVITADRWKGMTELETQQWIEDNFYTIAPIHEQCEQTLRNNFNIVIPGARFSYSNIEIGSTPWWNGVYRQVRFQIWGDVTAKTRALKNSFLVGIDETAPFICQLPETASSVAEAHELLRPEGLSDKAVRQGEWFFERIDIDAEACLDMLVEGSWAIGRMRPLEANSGHHATRAIVKRVYGAPDEIVAVSGTIKDRSQNRHADLKLEGWWKPIRNREVITAESIRNRTRYWD